MYWAIGRRDDVLHCMPWQLCPCFEDFVINVFFFLNLEESTSQCGKKWPFLVLQEHKKFFTQLIFSPPQIELNVRTLLIGWNIKLLYLFVRENSISFNLLSWQLCMCYVCWQDQKRPLFSHIETQPLAVAEAWGLTVFRLALTRANRTSASLINFTPFLLNLSSLLIERWWRFHFS